MNRPDIVFFQQFASPYFGVLSINAYLRHNGINTDVVIDTLEKDAIAQLVTLRPSLIGISVLSSEHQWLIDKTRAIRTAIPDAKIIVGGIHAIFYPEEIIRETEADLVCHSEGEMVLLQVLEQLRKRGEKPDWSLIDGLCYQDDKGVICCNERASLVSFSPDLIEDRGIYFDRYPELAGERVHRFFSSRGCPYRCTFCYNANIHDVFKGKGAYVRQKEVDTFIAEIVAQNEKYSIKSIFFYDDLFTYNKKWLKQFLSLYKEKINIPFMCTTRANLLDEDTASMLAEAGCITVSYGIETGNYILRRDVLRKDITDEQIISCGNILRKYRINVQTANMFCLPDESVADAFKTIELNIKANTDFAFSALFLPFPKTQIAQYCADRGYLKADYSLHDLPRSFLTTSILNLPDKDVIKNIHRLAYFFIKWPSIYRIARKMVYCNFLNPFFHGIFLLSNVLRHKGERATSWWGTLRYAWRFRKSV